MLRARALFVLIALGLGTAAPAFAASRDPLFASLWGLERVGAESAWKVTRGEGVLIAVIDTGVNLSHPDLKDRLVPGLSVVDKESADDTHGHGTLVSGIAAATADNNEGIAGVAPKASILPVRVFDSAGSATSGRVASAIRLAVDAAAARRSKLVLNLSFVGPVQPDPKLGEASNAIFGDEAVKKAIADAAAAGAAVILPSGNEGAPRPAFDAPDHKGIIVVGASDKDDKCAKFSNYGEGVDVLAPGVGILSTSWNPATKKAGYAYADGTSMSVPFVSGAAALLMSAGSTNIQAIDRIIATGSGPGVSCNGEASRYRILDVAAAMKVERIAGTPGPIPSPEILPAGTGTPSERAPARGEDPEQVDPNLGVSRLKGVAFFAFVSVLILFMAVIPERKRRD